MSKITVGETAPDFTLSSESGAVVSLAAARARGPVVLIFYPMDQTPGCTAQLCAARDDVERYTAAGVSVFGVNGGKATSHKKFVEKHGLTMPLLVDDGLARAPQGHQPDRRRRGSRRHDLVLQTRHAENRRHLSRGRCLRKSL
jgi:peroxiredoxin